MSNTLEPATLSPLELRAQLEDMVRKDLLGPVGGEEEVVAEPNVRGRYILGLLAPRSKTLQSGAL